MPSARPARPQNGTGRRCFNQEVACSGARRAGEGQAQRAARLRAFAMSSDSGYRALSSGRARFTLFPRRGAEGYQPCLSPRFLAGIVYMIVAR